MAGVVNSPSVPPIPVTPPPPATIEIAPGELVQADCPNASLPPLKVGDILPRGAAPDASFFVVARIEGSRVWLGPLKAGQHSVDVPCNADASSTISLNVKLAEVKAEDLPPPPPPLPPEKMAYPLWVWGLLLAVILALLASGVAVWLAQRRRQTSAAKRRPLAPARNPDEKFAHFLDSARKERFAEREESDAVKRFYTEANERLRDYLEFKLGFRAQEATTREFVGELKSALLRYNASPAEPGKPAPHRVPAEAPGIIESLMSQADQVRFAAERPPLELRQGFLKSLQQVRSLVGGP